jgi:hypothetical protein
MFGSIGQRRAGFDDFRTNGLMLPAKEDGAIESGRPLHRGPHRFYNEMVISRVGRIEEAWSSHRLLDAEVAAEQALMRLGLLQRALRRRLLDIRCKPFTLNRRDPLRMVDFTDLDAMAEALWGETEGV